MTACNDPRGLADAVAADDDQRLEAHFASCDACGAVVRSIREVGSAADHVPAVRRKRPIVWVAAAGWVFFLLTLVLTLRPKMSSPTGGGLLLRSSDVVLSSTRGPEGIRLDPAADVWRLHFVLGEDVAKGAVLAIEFDDAEGRILATARATVGATDEHEWPIVEIDARRIPKDVETIRVTSAAGTVAVYRVSVR